MFSRVVLFAERLLFILRDAVREERRRKLAGFPGGCNDLFGVFIPFHRAGGSSLTPGFIVVGFIVLGFIVVGFIVLVNLTHREPL